MKKLFFSVASCALLAMYALTARADSYPDRAIQLVVPAGAGTTTDLIARQFGSELSKVLDQTIVVQNKPGASGNIAHAYVAQAGADGYTLVLGNTGPLAINPALYTDLPFDPIKNFTPIVMLGYTPTLLVVKAESPWNSVKDLIASAKQSPNKLSFSSAGNGTTGHLASELLKSMSKTQMLHVPYKQGTQAVTAVIGGDVDFMFYHPAVVMPLIKAGKLKALGVSSAARTATDPSIVPLDAAGFPGFDLTGWFTVNAPSGLPANVLSRLVDASEKVVASPDFLARLTTVGIEPLKMDHVELTRYMTTELEKWNQVVKLSGAKVD
ncbi:tripartite tricarboxylate transporter substrate binding protein [Candidimonas sp. SYP-B2681]|uniref:Bug family tripartite tricarboxylate transporter substrate binding protein n=1 Tax=Candidimonas sp. SYP-B2681 TaxID=2497686 RepID=UPI000F8904DD|nr:tripartite tricarboxylate transporter substrate binding protein [Candidimonas sp. SYP-B2681]RTZ43210.1 tripartite tricarboxylate transporter substrate binding protein [Candidimonas sp. SYP-B2681]